MNQIEKNLASLTKLVTVGFKELREAQKKTDEQLAKTNAQLAKTDVQLAKTDAQVRKMSRKVDSLATNIGGISKTQGDIAEEFFYRSLDKNPCVADNCFQHVYRKLSSHFGNINDEYDIVLANGDSLLIVEVKTKAKPKIFNTMVNTKIPNFKKLFPAYKNYAIIGAVATLISTEYLVKRAKETGLLLLVPQGDHAVLMNKNFITF